METTRRGLLKTGASMVAAAPLMTPMQALAGVARDPVAVAFARASKTEPWTLGITGAKARDLDTASLECIAGKLPDGFEGTFYRNGPAQFERADWRYRHWFDGDGMVQRYRIAGGNVSHRGRFVQTPKLLTEDKAGRFIMPGFGSVPDPNYTVKGPDDLNAANTSVLPVGDKVLALWEGGSAFALDAATLETHGPKVWRADLKGVPFSAHPKVAPDGTIVNFGTGLGNNRLVLYRIAAGGTLIDARVVSLPRVGLMHDFLITKTHALFIANSWTYDTLRLPYVDSFKIEPDLPMLAMAVPLDGGETRVWELPPGFVFHFGNAYEESGGTIRFDAMFERNIAWPRDGAEALMRGVIMAPGTRMGLVTLKPGARTGTLEMHEGERGEFPKIDPRRVGERHRYLFHTEYDAVPSSFGATAIAKHDWETGQTDSFSYGPGMWVEEHLFVPDANGSGQEDAGHLIGTVLNLKKKRTELYVLDAQRVSDGPVAAFALPYALPAGFHGAWKDG